MVFEGFTLDLIGPVVVFANVTSETHCLRLAALQLLASGAISCPQANQREIWHPLRLAEYSDLPIGFVITSAARDLLAYGYEEKQIPRAKTGRS